MFAGLLPKTCLNNGRWSSGKKFFKQNYCQACHTRFGVFFPLPSCWVSLLLSSKVNWGGGGNNIFLPVFVNRLVPLLPPTQQKKNNNNNKNTCKLGMSTNEQLQKVIRESTVLAEKESYGFIAGLWVRTGRRTNRCSQLLEHWNRVHTRKIATIFQGRFKDHIRFSRTTYQECNFTHCKTMHILSPF